MTTTTTINFGKSFEFCGFECKPYNNTENAEDFGLDIYENGEYLCTCPQMTAETINCESLRNEFKNNDINIDPWARWNEKQYGKNWRDLYNGL